VSSRIGSRFATPKAPTLPTYLVVCEGKTEEQYFKQWERVLRGKAKFRILGSVGSPISLVEVAIKERANLIRSGIIPSNIRVWCVGDRDDHHRMEEALDHARGKDFGYALSIPCVELWFVLHFQEVNAYLHRDDAIRSSRDYLGIKTKNLSSSALEKLFANDNKAILRAQKLDQLHAGNGSDPLENPRSWLHILVLELKSL
jgi:hypothetical protein